MGFSLYFMRIENDKGLDADRDAVVAFLDQRELRVHPSGQLVDSQDQALKFDGVYTELTLDPLDQSEPLTGCIHHATLSTAECAFIYDLCAAAGFLIVSPEGNPTYLVPNRNHDPGDVSVLEGVVWIDSAEELQQALFGGFEAFRRFVQQVRSVGGRAAETPPR
ncbi:hypothetical protein CPI83_29610 (plasmid) [Rhodococcus sp. H-CA8f]|uniref:hypothetical protein n=1 Tax=Rhodococcus sp. H-CA8f TaxID=1727214 RepID=UPI000BE2F499|nr:hypothetical protein [Rhodococcus sp. H-CA8f]ATI36360.1 hypothetical protein CPI83_29610 [Rhodococcus sp. H-CA8f]